MNFENQIILGDSLEVMREMPDNSVDLMATDPPYGYSFMGKDWDTFNEIVNPQGAYEHKKGFKKLPRNKPFAMYEAFLPMWKECLRVLKPGAFAFVMCAPRQDVMMKQILALTDAGFNTGFTSMYWTYASGFPKASNIGKMVDRRKCKKQLEKELGRKPTKKEFERAWKNFRKVVKINEKYYNKKKAEINRGIDNRNPLYQNSGLTDKEAGFQNVSTSHLITSPTTPQAKALNGSYAGFQPKPAVEVILVAMKPLSEKTYVDQALKNRKGITWMDDCMVPYESEGDKESARFGTQMDIRNNNYKTPKGIYGKNVLSSQNGRFVANLLVSDDVMNDGYKKGTKPHPIISNVEGYEGWGSITKKQGEIVNYGDSGSFSRYFDLDKWFCKTFPFFIVPKASKGEKNRGLEGFEEKKSRKWEHDKGMKYTGSGKPRIEKDKNYHPTVKPIKLMTYLITLGSREGDIVLDPFVGSGTTCVSCKMLNRKYIGIDNKEEYVKISKARIKAVPLDLFSS